MKPTIIHTEKVRPDQLKPTVIQAMEHEAAPLEKASLKPSVISAPKKHSPKPSVMAPINEKEPEEKAARLPSKISGKERKRLPVSLEDLRLENPKTKEEDLHSALQYVLETDIDLLNGSSALLWQAELQKQYSDQVMQLLGYTQHDAFTKANHHISRITEVLDAIDLRGVCDYEKDGVITKFFKSSNKEFDTPEELHHAEKELTQLTALLSQQLKSLIQLQATLRTINHEVVALGRKIWVASMAADFLSKYMARVGANKKLADQFLERSMSLAQTAAQILENEVARESQVEHPLKLISAIQNTVLIMIPDWLGSITTIRSMIEQHKKVTVTEVDELSDWKKKIIIQLN